MQFEMRRIGIIILAWLAAIAVATLLDGPIATQVRQWGTDYYLRTRHPLRELLKFPGEFYYTVVLAIVVGFLHRRGWRASVMLLLMSAISSVNWFMQWSVGRIRPFKTILGGDTDVLSPFSLHPFPFLNYKFLEVRNLCFPSGHTALAFATATALGILWPRWRWVFYSFAAVVAVERLLENAHWLSDVIAAVALGVGGVKLASRFIWTEKTGELKHE